MKKSSIISCSILALSAALLSSCDNRVDISGVWSGTPSRIENIDGADLANATMTLVFSNDSVNNPDKGGNVFISALIDANQAVSSKDATLDAPYEVSVAATATITGTWSYEAGEDDDIVIVLDPQSMQVKVDPHGVTFSNDVLTGTQQPVLDSLSHATANAWTKSISAAMSDKFYSLSKISDIKISNGIMSCEINDRDYTFRKQSE